MRFFGGILSFWNATKCSDAISNLVFGANFYANATHATAPDVLKMLFHIPRAKLGVKIAGAVRFG